MKSGQVAFEGESLSLAGERIAVNRGTPALLAAALKTTKTLGAPPPFTYLVGDIGLGHGSLLLYEHLADHLPQANFSTLTFHYLQPIVHWHAKILGAIEIMPERPRLIADAGYMYMAKMSGRASAYDLFTPDVGELAFLADEEAPHPFYTRGFILQEENRVPDLIERAYHHNNTAQNLLVKGRCDYLADRDGVVETVDGPNEEAMEAMGGTGDTLTGIASALIETGMPVGRAAIVAAKVNRLAGSFAKPSPATQVIEIIRQIPQALKQVL
ncbi:NAD(P)H-hydrate dehydratase [Trichloromonas sp.]|uniref:NAD(P)H-hydrate dehydratase n=1 Tax=Trichloromonas sp. TaxID=3069249 RepID=UPI002A3F56B8|nr:NAD(P)H-hydrate dehydratase [Trichloromonas sp.]